MEPGKQNIGWGLSRCRPNSDYDKILALLHILTYGKMRLHGIVVSLVRRRLDTMHDFTLGGLLRKPQISPPFSV